MDRIALKAMAKEQIKGKIGILLAISVIISGIIFVANKIPIAGGIVTTFFLTPAFSLSMILIYFKVSEGNPISVGDAFEGFYHFWGAFKVTFLAGLFTFLWSLLLIVPGIIKSYSYSMSLYIYAENKDMGALEAINKSKEMMEGHKMDLFVLQLSFLGWTLLGVVTLGIAFIWVIPYMYATYVNFYKSLKPAEFVDIPAEDIQIEEVSDNNEE